MCLVTKCHKQRDHWILACRDQGNQPSPNPSRTRLRNAVLQSGDLQSMRQLSSILWTERIAQSTSILPTSISKKTRFPANNPSSWESKRALLIIKWEQWAHSGTDLGKMEHVVHPYEICPTQNCKRQLRNTWNTQFCKVGHGGKDAIFPGNFEQPGQKAIWSMLWGPGTKLNDNSTKPTQITNEEVVILLKGK